MCDPIPSAPPITSWRQAAQGIIEELIRQLPPRAWDDLLDLRLLLRHGAALEDVVDFFLHCRKAYEKDAYLPFYRLRTLLATSLALRGRGTWQHLPLPPLEMLLRQRHGSLREWKRQLEREWFEQGLEPARCQQAQIELIEVR